MRPGTLLSSYGIYSIANPHLNNNLGAIIAFPDEIFGLSALRMSN
jgi:hypothetical protein